MVLLYYPVMKNAVRGWQGTESGWPWARKGDKELIKRQGLWLTGDTEGHRCLLATCCRDVTFFLAIRLDGHGPVLSVCQALFRIVSQSPASVSWGERQTHRDYSSWFVTKKIRFD